MSLIPKNNLQDEVVFLTGASRGVGRAIATVLASAGAYRLCLIARSKKDLEETGRCCEQANPLCSQNLLIAAVDVTNTTEMEKVVASCMEKFGKISTVIHNVGLHGLQSAVSASIEEIDKNIQLNLLSVIHVNRLVLPHLVRTQQTQQARVFFLSSALATKWAMAPGWTAYTASKCGITGYADACFAELRQSGMKVTVIYPGLIQTDMGSEFADDFGKLLDRRIKPDQYLQPDDIAQAVLALCSRPLVGSVTELTLYPQADLYRMKILTEPSKIQAIVDAPFPNFVDRRIAFITGAGKGIGRGIALRLARDGFNLAVVARTQSDLDSLKVECQKIYDQLGFTNARILSFAIDVTDKEGLQKSVESVVQTFGTLSVVVSNAGTNRRKNAALADIKIWEDLVQTNMISGMHLTRLALPHLLRHAHRSSSKSSYLIFVNSSYASSRAPTLPGTAIYAATKSAMAGFARTVLEDVRAWNVKVTTIYPGLVNTELGTRPNPQQKEGKGIGSGGGLLLPPQDMIQSEDIGELVSYCCSVPQNCVVTDLTIDTPVNQQPIIRDLTKAFAAAHWPQEISKL